MSPELIRLLVQATGDTLTMVALAASLGTLFGLPLGIFLATSRRGELLAAPIANAVLGFVVNATRSTPFIILVVAIIPFTRLIAGTSIGTLAATVPLTVAATPFLARLIEAAIREVDPGLVEAARAFGARPGQIIAKVLVPEALPGIVSGLTLAVVSLLGFSAMVGAVGGGGLGDLGIRYGYQRFRPEMMLAVVVVLVVLVQAVQTVGEGLARRLNRRIRPAGRAPSHSSRRQPGRSAMLRALTLAALLAVSGPLLPIAVRAEPLTRIRIGATSGPHAQILEAVKPIAAKRGLDLQIIEFSDYVVPNEALSAGEIEANSFQNQPFLDNQRADRGYRITGVGLTVNFPLGIYSKRHRSFDAVPNGGTVAIQNDPTNGGRSLLLLQDKGVIKLAAGTGFTPTVADIVENPCRLRFIEVDAAQTPRALEDVDAAAVNTNYATPAGLKPSDALLKEEPKGPYVNMLAVREADRDKPWVKTLVESYRTPETKAFVESTFGGAVLTSW